MLAEFKAKFIEKGQLLEGAVYQRVMVKKERFRLFGNALLLEQGL